MTVRTDAEIEACDTDDLVARARKLAEHERAHAVGYISTSGRVLDECAARIEALDGALREIIATAPSFEQPGHRTCIEIARAALTAGVPASPAPPADGWRPTHRHRKGGEYRLLREHNAYIEADWSPCFVYENDRGVWIVRPLAELHDGRFTPLPAPPAPSTPAPDGWRPIETAPKGDPSRFDGPELLLGSIEGVHKGYWCNGDSQQPPGWIWDGDRDPTHWQPVPAAPGGTRE